MRQGWTNRPRVGTMTRGGTILSVVLLAGSAALAAGNNAPAPGTRVRLTTPERRVVGRLVELNGESVVLARDKRGGAESLSVDRRKVVGIEVSERQSRKKSWAARGALAGLVAALAVGVAAGESCSGNEMVCFDHGTTALGAAVLAVPVGALVGAAVAPGERWRPAPVAGLTVQPLAVQGGGLGVRVAIGF